MRRIGDLVAIDLGDERLAFGLVLEEPLVAFFDFSTSKGEVPDVEELVKRPVAFRIWVMNRPLQDGTWPVIGHVRVPERFLEKPWFFKQDPISRKVTIGRTGAEEVEPGPEVALDSLECASVWSGEHVVERLRDYLDGRPNKWVESMRVTSPR